MDTLPLFPLGQVLFPYGKVMLRVFEPRYLDLAAQSLRRGEHFGVVLIRRGSEVADADSARPELMQVGCCAEIIDWQGLGRNELGISIQGSAKRFRIAEVAESPNRLMVAEVEMMESEQSAKVPSEFFGLVSLLVELQKHPMISEKLSQVNYENAVVVSNVLAQLLPVGEQEKYCLLTLTGGIARLKAIKEIVARISQ